MPSAKSTIPISGMERKSYIGQTGQRFSYEIDSTPFDLSLVTEVTVRFQPPAGAAIKDKVIADGVTVVEPPESRNFEDDLGNTFTLANVQVEYTVDDAALFDVAGTWRTWVEVLRTGTYDHVGKATEFEVLARGQA